MSATTTPIDVKTTALRLVLADLTEDEQLRQSILDASPAVLAALVGFFLTHFTDGIVRTCGGSRQAAILEITRVLNRESGAS